MRVNPKIRSVQNAVDTVLVTTTETVVATLVGVSTQSPDGIVRVSGMAQVTGGTNTTFVTARIRRGTTIAGTLIGEADAATLTGAAQGTFPVTGEETPGEISNASYVLTVQLTAATANGNVPFASMQAIS